MHWFYFLSGWTGIDALQKSVQLIRSCRRERVFVCNSCGNSRAIGCMRLHPICRAGLCRSGGTRWRCLHLERRALVRCVQGSDTAASCKPQASSKSGKAENSAGRLEAERKTVREWRRTEDSRPARVMRSPPLLRVRLRDTPRSSNEAGANLRTRSRKVPQGWDGLPGNCTNSSLLVTGSTYKGGLVACHIVDHATASAAA